MAENGRGETGLLQTTLIQGFEDFIGRFLFSDLLVGGDFFGLALRQDKENCPANVSVRAVKGWGLRCRPTST